jgi:hypothetical protein
VGWQRQSQLSTPPHDASFNGCPNRRKKLKSEDASRLKGRDGEAGNGLPSFRLTQCSAIARRCRIATQCSCFESRGERNLLPVRSPQRFHPLGEPNGHASRARFRRVPNDRPVYGNDPRDDAPVIDKAQRGDGFAQSFLSRPFSEVLRLIVEAQLEAHLDRLRDAPECER